MLTGTIVRNVGVGAELEKTGSKAFKRSLCANMHSLNQNVRILTFASVLQTFMPTKSHMFNGSPSQDLAFCIECNYIHLPPM